jgi:hypothetical protein
VDGSRFTVPDDFGAPIKRGGDAHVSIGVYATGDGACLYEESRSAAP